MSDDDDHRHDTNQQILKTIFYDVLLVGSHPFTVKIVLLEQSNHTYLQMTSLCFRHYKLQQFYCNIVENRKMPFTFHVEIKQSQIEGKGVFALQDIPSGAIIWTYECQNPLPLLGHQLQPNRVFDCEQLQALQHEEIHIIFHSAVYLPTCDLLVNYRDGTQFTNHSENPNSQTVFPATKDHRDLKIIALKPIKKGQEIFEDYYNLTHQTGWLIDSMERHSPERLAYEKQLCQEFAKRQKLQENTQ